MITCKLTGNKGKGVKKLTLFRKHFMSCLTKVMARCKLITNTNGVYPKKLPIGVYDQTIVTKEGEAIFGDWDNYAAHLLLENLGEQKEVTRSNELIAWQIAEYDYSLLKLFALSMLWRAHSSSQLSFSKVNLGPHEPTIKNILLESNPGLPDQYSVNIARWLDEEFGPVFMDPFIEKYSGVNFYRFYCGRYVFYIKVDKRKNIGILKEMQLGATKALYLIARRFSKSKERTIMQNIAKNTTLTKW